MATKKATTAAKANGVRSTAKRNQNAPRAKHRRDDKTFGLNKCDPETQAYHHGCIDGEHRAELCIQEFRQNPGITGSGMMYGYIERIRGETKNPRIRGMMVGFCSKLEKELGRLQMEDAWRSATHQERWAFTDGLRDSRAKAKQLTGEMIAKMEAGEEPNSEEWGEVLACADGATRTILAAIRAVRAEESAET